jgi:hypothetical protein
MGITAASRPLTLRLQEMMGKRGATVRTLFGTSEERLAKEASMLPSLAKNVPVPDLSVYYRVEAEDEQLEDIAKQLLETEVARAAYIKPPSELPFLNTMLPSRQPTPPSTPDFTSNQIYLGPSPSGVDAQYAWTKPGGTGNGVMIVDIEGAWRFSHEDLQNNKGGVVGGTPPDDVDWRNHGTAVNGGFGADKNAIGVKGNYHAEEVNEIKIFPSEDTAPAIRLAAQRLRPGDIILVEIHRAGPRFNFQPRNDQRGYISVEWWQDDFDAIQYATSRGIIVVEAGGNGAEDLDDSIYDRPGLGFPSDWTNPFNRSNRDCGAIIVGAGAPPPGTHGNNNGPDRSRLDFSNYGSSIDAQGWGLEVTSAAYGDLQGGTAEDSWYTNSFGGTSSASPVVVGVLGCAQGVLRASGSPLLTPATARNILRTKGARQQDGPAGPASQRIGNRPDLRAIV